MIDVEEIIAKYKELSPFERFFKYLFIHGISYDDIDFQSKAIQRLLVSEQQDWPKEKNIAFMQRFTALLASNQSIPTAELIPEGRTVYIQPFPRYMGDPIHSHCDAMEINFVLQGELIQIVGGHTLNLSRGDVCFVAPGVSHITRTYGDDSVVLSLFVYSHRVPALICEFDCMLDAFLKKIAYSRNVVPYVIVSDVLDASLVYLIADLAEKQTQRHPLTDLCLLSGLKGLILRVMMHDGDRMMSGSDIDRHDADIRNLMDYIRLNVSTVSLESLSETFHYSPTYLSALIKAKYGSNFKDIVARLKLERAVQLLETTDYNVSTIANLAGYTDKSYFHRAFKKTYGLTPLEYRGRKADQPRGLP